MCDQFCGFFICYRKLALWCCTAIVSLLVITPVWAGSTAASSSLFTPEQLVAFSKQVEKHAAAQGARVFLLSRVGRPAEDLTEGVEFTHVGIAVYSMITTSTGEKLPGYAIYNLYMNEDDDTKSHLAQDYPVDFFAAAYELKAGISIPTAKLQQRILDVITSSHYQSLHNEQYSTLSNPFNLAFQNCTEFVLDVINAAIYQSFDRKQLKANSAAYFEPQPIEISRLKLRLGAMLMDELSLTDHRGKVKTATYGSISRYLKKYNLLEYQQVVTATELAAKPITPLNSI